MLVSAGGKWCMYKYDGISDEKEVQKVIYKEKLYL